MAQAKTSLWHWTPDASKLFTIRMLLSWGFNDQAVAELTHLHRVTVGRYRKILREQFEESVDAAILAQKKNL